MMKRKTVWTRETAALAITRWAKKWLKDNKGRRRAPRVNRPKP
jgi:hypothetical protein